MEILLRILEFPGIVPNFIIEPRHCDDLASSEGRNNLIQPVMASIVRGVFAKTGPVFSLTATRDKKPVGNQVTTEDEKL